MHSDCGILVWYKGSSTLYRNPPHKGPKSVQTSKSDHGNRFNLPNLVLIRIQKGGHCPEYSHYHSGIKKQLWHTYCIKQPLSITTTTIIIIIIIVQLCHQALLVSAYCE
jgi:hypothetical protein